MDCLYCVHCQPPLHYTIYYSSGSVEDPAMNLLSKSPIEPSGYDSVLVFVADAEKIASHARAHSAADTFVLCSNFADYVSVDVEQPMSRIEAVAGAAIDFATVFDSAAAIVDLGDVVLESLTVLVSQWARSGYDNVSVVGHSSILDAVLFAAVAVLAAAEDAALSG